MNEKYNLLSKITLLIGIVLVISSCGDDEKDLMLYNYVRINIPNGIDGSKTKLNVYIELDSTETVINPNADFFAFPTPFKQQFSIYMEIGIADYYKIVVKNIDENKIYYSDEQYFEMGGYSYEFSPESLNMPEGFYEIQLHRNQEIKHKSKVLYWNRDNFVIDDEKLLLKVWSDYINDESYFDLGTDFKFLLNNELERILPDGQVLQSYFIKSYILIRIEDDERNVINEKRIRFDEFASKNEFNFN